jgi:pimeloyl-ACP methyl ester carboxylesterase
MMYVALVALGVVGAMVLSLYVLYQRDLRESRQRVRSGGTVVQTACGPIEYAETGDGPPALLVHGAGGGYDQGLLFARLLGGGYRWIVPSRFGYLGTALPEGASTPGQADAHACLLDALGVERVPVVGVSAGGPSSLQLALRHPQRCSALVMLSAVSRADPPRSGLAGAALQGVVTSDLPFWLMSSVARPLLRSMLGVTREAQAHLGSEDLALIDEFLRAIPPIELRRDGILFDLSLLVADAPYPLAQIHAPTLVVHSRDDSLVSFAHAEHTSRGSPGARLVALEEGGHMGYPLRAGAIDEVRAFLRRHAYDAGASQEEPRT